MPKGHPKETPPIYFSKPGTRATLGSLEAEQHPPPAQPEITMATKPSTSSSAIAAFLARGGAVQRLPAQRTPEGGGRWSAAADRRAIKEDGEEVRRAGERAASPAPAHTGERDREVYGAAKAAGVDNPWGEVEAALSRPRRRSWRDDADSRAEQRAGADGFTYRYED